MRRKQKQQTTTKYALRSIANQNRFNNTKQNKKKKRKEKRVLCDAEKSVKIRANIRYIFTTLAVSTKNRK